MKRKVIVVAMSIVAILCWLGVVGLGLCGCTSMEAERIERSNEAFRATCTALAMYGPPTPVPEAPGEVWRIKPGRELDDLPLLWYAEMGSAEWKIGGLAPGTRMRPGGQGCKLDPRTGYVLCQVVVVDGPLKGKLGLVNQDFIDK